jgi:hypothetical protein
MRWPRSRGTILALAVALALAACYSELDWREFTSPEGGFTVMLPSKPARESRELVLAGSPATMHMISAHAPEMAFGVGYADLPPSTDPGRTVDEGRVALLRNIGGVVIAERALDGVTGVEFEAEGAAEGNPMRLAARVLVSGNRYYQVVLVARSARAGEVDRALFPGSFKLIQ